ncbi:hypothetical protein [Paraburkholderia sp. BL27I4N3]|uniref:hypothetical protein n=1 Tax=Paraburkholderia sp. BL27I4N3 TaxID=1938805 RepID=UPI002163B64C|nr:hypothetical protein [Paraburkholderia sp. BL27I4N3]
MTDKIGISPSTEYIRARDESIASSERREQSLEKVAVPVGLAMLKVARHGADKAVFETADIRALSRSASRPALDLHTG